MQLKQVANTVALTTFIFTPNYVDTIVPANFTQANSYNFINSTDINFVEIEKSNVENFIYNVTNITNLSIDLKRYSDDADYIYVSIFSTELDINQLFDLEEQLNDEAVKYGKKFIFTVGE